MSLSDTSAVPANTLESVRDLQNRLARFARTVFVISGVMLAASLINALLTSSDAAPISRPSRLAHVFGCLEKSPDDRPASAAALHVALAQCAVHTPYDASSGRRWWQERGAALRARQKSERHVAPAASMTIDLRGRALPTA